jgi:hypothetical protein
MIKNSRQHLKSVNENYLEHILVTFKVGYDIFCESLFALIHGLIPGLFQNSASIKIKELYEFINKKR